MSFQVADERLRKDELRHLLIKSGDFDPPPGEAVSHISLNLAGSV